MKSIVATLPLVSALHGMEDLTKGCADCNFDLTVLEEFTTQWVDVKLENYEHPVDGHYVLTTAPPVSLPQSHGSLAVHARNLQLKLDSDTTMQENFALGGLPLGGANIHEEIHMNGATNQASYHLSSPILNLCVLLDAPSGLPPVSQIQADQVNQMLDQAEQIATPLIQNNGYTGTIDGVDAVSLAGGHHPFVAVAFDMDSHPSLLYVEPSPNEVNMWYHLMTPHPDRDELDAMGLKFTGYEGSVGDAFSVRACSIETQSATATMLSSNTELKDFAKNRVSRHTANLQRLLQNPGLNTRFNFLDFNLAEKLFPESNDCGSVLVEKTESSGFTGVSVFSYVAGLATSAFALLAYSKFNKKNAEQDSAYSVM